MKAKYAGSDWPVADMLAGRDRNRAGPTAPSQGLRLDEVFYCDGPREAEDDGD